MESHCCENIKCPNLTNENNLHCSTCNRKFAAKCLMLIPELLMLLKLLKLVVEHEFAFDQTRWNKLVKIVGKNSPTAFVCTDCKQVSHKQSIDNILSEIEITKIQYEEKFESIKRQLNDLKPNSNEPAIPTSSFVNTNPRGNRQKEIPSETLAHNKKQDSNKPIVKKPKEQTVYSIFASKFPVDTKPEDLTQIILNGTNIGNPDLFKIELIRSKNWKYSKNKYLSFKISTFTKELFDTIMNANIWNPDHSVCVFESHSDRLAQVQLLQRQQQQHQQKPKQQLKQQPEPKSTKPNHPNVKQSKPNNTKQTRMNTHSNDHKQFRNRGSRNQQFRNRNQFDNREHQSNSYEPPFYRDRMFHDFMRFLQDYRDPHPFQPARFQRPHHRW